MEFEKQSALITGGASGLGRKAAQLFCERGVHVIVADVNEEKGIQTVTELRENGGKADFIQVNVADEASVQTLIEGIRQKIGRLDILINNAGITRDGMLHKMGKEKWDQVIAINLTGVYVCTKAAIPLMLENGYGRIINTSSVVGLYGNIGQTNYAAAKAGVIGLTKTWAKELGAKGITVNAVAPGFIRTPMLDAVPEKILEMMRQKVPVLRIGEAEDIARAYVFLASPQSSYINGAVLSVDGGLTL
ncbi:3-oxoacyl-ACP reductase FabG [Aneurinibacillus aneurinilyticus]|jgi:3-oxoacyl-[acyl-carrier protein] reductase|uniref:3-oxoacyl-ACP reductase FabG n=2 Tax=Aneurinibacillus aneurinilyticus TaxID=1391 RepID=A0A848CZY4_ANEAE|nr:3-oxoacyl-ACP reductase FabG [Aneurinibacillus aneurinilyticus]ERI10139.1 putative 3-oxoacyl-[acyl-carrier-protein] reductase [Aneurinibacillus aneurinilyticus ATCC 12856]MCI1692524.1 3-oxoacyl-ACP reductase FabG [Aneurinibacillus aneurinilyticus]MED0705216.1 3-oxoacyl-ACP reductase FabG [Aneurinibacillus aneurinilyticus]MED0723023.1 3-oxoacyl-ACP reductase FabG [Aneurinibacillus aneurinilyticus]MED0733542.1 3-oxoacyl-ACP reductase FabG [Aneurinibacillus aneurinilyticus]